MHNLIALLCLLSYSSFAKEIDVLVPTKDIKKGEVITADDLTVEIIDSKVNKGYVTVLDGDNTKAKRNLEAGQPMRKCDIFQDDSAVHQGENITIRFVKKNLTIEMQGIALSNGRMHEVIRVKIIDSNKVLNAKIIEIGVVAVN